MFMKNIISTSLLILFLLSSLVADESQIENKFSEIKQQMNKAGCISIELISVLESSVFDSIDSTNGTAVISRDGRYNIQLGTDIYLYDLQKSYSYSEGTNQVIIEDVADPEMMGREISFIKNLDELYITKALENNKIYRLTLIDLDDKISDIPDSMIIYISNNKHFDSLSFFDHNEDLNLIYFINQEISDTCKDSYFIPDFPDSVEKVRF